EETIAVHAVAERLERHVLDRHGAREGSPHRVLVVLADEDDGELPERGQREALVEPSDAHRALAEEAARAPPGLPVLAREGASGGERDVPADDAVPAQHVMRLVEEVHRSAEALGAAGHLTEELR